MIEIRASVRTDLSWPTMWEEVGADFFNINSVNVYRWDIRINGVVYSDRTQQLIDALHKEKEWVILAGKMKK